MCTTGLSGLCITRLVAAMTGLMRNEESRLQSWHTTPNYKSTGNIASLYRCGIVRGGADVLIKTIATYGSRNFN